MFCKNRFSESNNKRYLVGEESVTEVDNRRTLPHTLYRVGGHHISIVGYSPEQAQEHVGEECYFVGIERIRRLLDHGRR